MAATPRIATAATTLSAGGITSLLQLRSEFTQVLGDSLDTHMSSALNKANQRPLLLAGVNEEAKKNTIGFPQRSLLESFRIVSLAYRLVQWDRYQDAVGLKCWWSHL